jgi:hypothetical protein
MKERQGGDETIGTHAAVYVGSWTPPETLPVLLRMS